MTEPQSAGKPVVVTGFGMVTPLGIGAETTWQAVLAGKCGIHTIRRFDPTGFPVRIAAEVPLPGSSASLKASLTEIALSEALQLAKVPGGPRLGVCLGSEAARPPLEWLAQPELAISTEQISALAPNAPTQAAAKMAGALGPQSTVSTACTSSSQAIGEALLKIRRGEVDAMVTGGVDVLSEPLMVVGFAKLGALSTRNEDPQGASRPFDKHRDGFVLGEGAGFLILESEEFARKRGATILATLAGWGCSCNAWRITDSPPDGRGPAQAMQAALKDAGLDPEQIGYVNAHGTSTPQNDASESAAIERVFLKGVPVSSTKGHMGHLVAACGAVEAILCIQALRDRIAPAGRHLEEPDPACRIELIRGENRPLSADYALTNAFGFGGSNGSLIFGRAR